MLAMRLYQRQRRLLHDPINDLNRTWLLVAAAFGALFGSRLLGSLEAPVVFLAGGGAMGWKYYLTAKTIVGGLLGGLFAVEFTKRRLKIRERSGDVYVFPLLLAMIIGRIGCFGMGVLEPTYGIPTTSWAGLDLGDGIPRHATSLYEIIFLLTWAGLLHWLRLNADLRPGRLFMLFLSGYLVYRFCIGFLQPLVPVAGLGSIQWACLLGLVWYACDEFAGEAAATT